MKITKLEKAIERAKSFKSSQNKGDVLNDTEQDMLVLHERLQYLERIRARGRQMSGGYCADRDCKERIQTLESLLGQHGKHWTAVADELGECYGGIDGPTKDPLSTGGVVVARIKAMKKLLNDGVHQINALQGLIQRQKLGELGKAVYEAASTVASQMLFAVLEKK